MNADRTLKGFFWVAFGVFLTASIPHIAYFFKAFEPDGWWYWLIAYAIAISIDITVFLLSLTVAEMRHRKAPNWLVATVWFFIGGLALLSWFINWEYATQFQSNMLNKPGSIAWVSFINPIIASMFQALAIAYTWISDKIYVQEKSTPEISPQVTGIAEIANNPVEFPAIAAPSNKDEILQFMAENPTMKQKEIALKLGVSESKISRLKKGA